jgi:ADP-ribosylglycohydrolase
MVGEMAGNMAGDAIGQATGRGFKNTIHTPYGSHVDGIPNPVVSKISIEKVKKHGYQKKQRNPNGLHISGGSFLAL